LPEGLYYGGRPSKQVKIIGAKMLRIGDFSKFGLVSVKTLRYYDEIDLLKPVKVDELTGYRYYSADQLASLYKINGLKNLGLSLEEIRLFMDESQNPAQLIELLRIKQKQAREHLREEHNRLKRLEEWLQKCEKEGSMPAYDVVIKKVEAETVASIREVIPGYGAIGNLFGPLYVYTSKKRLKVTGPPIGIYHDPEYREKDADVEAAVPVSGNPLPEGKVKVSQLPAVEQMACLVYKGPYEEISRGYQAVMSWIENNAYKVVGPCREVYLKGPGRILKGNPVEYITEIQQPIQKM
jgi:effector-binding domain-containing protein